MVLVQRVSLFNRYALEESKKLGKPWRRTSQEKLLPLPAAKQGRRLRRTPRSEHHLPTNFTISPYISYDGTISCVRSPVNIYGMFRAIIRRICVECYMSRVITCQEREYEGPRQTTNVTPAHLQKLASKTTTIPTTKTLDTYASISSLLHPTTIVTTTMHRALNRCPRANRYSSETLTVREAIYYRACVNKDPHLA